MASSSNPPDALGRIQDYEYLYASNTNVSNFVSVKLSGYENYDLWKTQMLCLMEAHEMRGLVDDTPIDLSKTKITKKYDSLLKGWIFGSISEDVLRTVVDPKYSARDVWYTLKRYFDSTKSSDQQDADPSKADTNTEKEEKNVVLAEITIYDEDTKADETALRKLKIEDVNFSETEIKEKDMDSLDSVKDGNSDSDSDSESVQTDTKDSAEKMSRYSNFQFQLFWRTEPAVELLREGIEEGNWDFVYAVLLKHKRSITEKINSDGNTILHIAVGIGRNDYIKKISKRMVKDHDLTQIKNNQGSTVLHIAAIVGNTNAAEFLVELNERLLHVKDKYGKTPLDKAYENMHLNTVAYLLEAADTQEKSNKGSDSVGENKKPAIVDPSNKKVAAVDGTNQPAADADKTHKPKSPLLPVEIGVDLLVNAISAKQYDFASKLMEKNPEYAAFDDNVLMAVAKTFPSGLEYGETLIYPNLDNMRETIVKRSRRLFNLLVDIFSSVKESISSIFSCEDKFHEVLLYGVWLILGVPAAMVWWIFLLILLLLTLVYSIIFMHYFLFWKVATRIVPPIRNIEQRKKENEDAKMVLELVCKKINELHADGHHSFYSRPVLEAACQNAYEVVAEILTRWPEAIRCKDENGYDIIQLATIHRSEKIYNLIYIMGERKSIYGTIVDSSKNNMLHLAGRLAPTNKLKRRTGAALQLQRELQWRQEVKKLVFPAYATKENIFKDTPEMVFTKEHENLVKEGEEWIKTVAESCSITAALITTIVFAAAITVPGGNDQETGAPVFLRKFVFNVFAIADAISLFSSATALLVFLSILTARFAEDDFLLRLPRRLIIGLCTLLLSTTAMMVAFSATLFLVFSHKKLWVLAPICGLAFLPIAIFFILQFPLIVDLFRSTYISKFGKSNYNSNKSNPNDIRFFFGK